MGRTLEMGLASFEEEKRIELPVSLPREDLARNQPSASQGQSSPGEQSSQRLDLGLPNRQNLTINHPVYDI